MRRTLALLIAAALLAAVPAAPAQTAAPTATATAKKAKGKKLTAKQKRCVRRAKRIRSKRARAKAIRKCTAPKRKRAPRRRPALKLPRPSIPIPAPAPIARGEGGIDDVTVVAVLDGGINPYHWDFLAAKMPQHTDADPRNDLPLDRPASEWLDGYGEAAKGFSSFTRLDLSLNPTDPADLAQSLNAGDGKLEGVKQSDDGSRHAYWLPGTKIIGAMSFSEAGNLWQGVDAHGVGTTSSVAGNLHGTCPECLLFFIDFGDTAEQAEQAIEWAESQPWIDVISNSYGHGGAVPKIYSGTDTEVQRAASERGQTVVFSAGNGVENAYTVANPTTLSSQKGPDWLVTVGAVSPGADNHYGSGSGSDDGGNYGGSYSGAGKPVDVAGVGDDYPNAYTAAEVGATGDSGFGGTSNAAPTVAGLYARALYVARSRLGGPSRIQRDGVVATGTPTACGAARPGCELGDGRLTAVELRTRLFHGAVHTSAGLAVYNVATGDPTPTAPPIGEEEFLNEGHGTYFARQAGPERRDWLDELDRVIAPMEGRTPTLVRPDGELEWMVVDSYCRQRNWGAWPHGYYVEGQTALPGSDAAWPVRSSYQQSCPGGPTPP